MNSPSHKSQLNAQLILIRKMLQEKQSFEQIKPLILEVHAHLHAQTMTGSIDWSYQDEILAGVPTDWMRIIPEGEDHSIAWLLWHLTRCEDITMNLLVAGSPQVLNQDDWLDRIKTPICHTGNEMDEAGVARFSASIDVGELRAYRVAVGRRTQEIVKQLGPGDLKQKVDPARLQRVWDERAVVEAASGIVDYWGKRNVAGLLLMPASRHLIVHLNEALKLKRRRQ